MIFDNEITLTITRLQECEDKEGHTYLKAKGYHTFKQKRGTRTLNAFNFFTSIRLYPISQEQLDETKNRLFQQTVDKPKIKVKVYKSQLFTPLINGSICPTLHCFRWDFATQKLYRKNYLLKLGEKQ